MTTEQRLPRPQRKRTAVAMLAVIAVAGLVLALAITLLPTYVTLPVTAPNASLPRGGWYSSERVVQDWEGGRERFYVLRLRSTARSEDFATQEEVVTFIERQLSVEHWVRHPSSAFSLCTNSLPESAFLSPGVGGWLAYVRNGADPYGVGPTVCLAVWPYSGTQPADYVVVLASVKPSLWTVLHADLQ